MNDTEKSLSPNVEDNPEGLREIERTIASTLLFSSDNRLLMGRKDPNKGGVYSNVWHIPGGGVNQGESLEDAAIRETLEEVGLQLDAAQLIPAPTGEGQTVKTLEGGERVWCKMRFNRFEVHLDKTADELSSVVRPGDDLVELAWYSPEELAHVEQIPGGKEFFIEQGYIAA